jgi:hypothetical protein
VMYDIPSRKGVRECIVTPGVIRDKEEPLLVYEHDDYQASTQSDKSALA